MVRNSTGQLLLQYVVFQIMKVYFILMFEMHTALKM